MDEYKPTDMEYIINNLNSIDKNLKRLADVQEFMAKKRFGYVADGYSW